MKSFLAAVLLLAGSGAALAQPAPRAAPSKAESPLAAQLTAAADAKDWPKAEALAKTLVAENPSEWRYKTVLGAMEMNLAHYDEAVADYQSAVDAGRAALKAKPAEAAKTRPLLAAALVGLGNANLKQRKTSEAVAAYSEAAELDPKPAVAYFNLCATQYNAGNVDGALAACDKALAADPTKADAWFIKGSLMLGGSTADAQGKLKAPAGAAEALNKYLELQPDGPHAKDVKDMLAAIGAPIVTTYQQRK